MITPHIKQIVKNRSNDDKSKMSNRAVSNLHGLNNRQNYLFEHERMVALALPLTNKAICISGIQRSVVSRLHTS